MRLLYSYGGKVGFSRSLLIQVNLTILPNLLGRYFPKSGLIITLFQNDLQNSV